MVTEKPSSHGLQRRPRRALAAWCLYDWANSAHPTVIVTFLFSAYFTRAVAESSTHGTAVWGRTMAAVGLVVALTSPVLGAIADRTGRRKPWIALFTLVTVAATAMLYFTQPSPQSIPWAVGWLLIGGIAFDYAAVFYNSMLPSLVAPERIGRASGWAWGLGYAGGLACLGTAYFVLLGAGAPASAEPASQTQAVRASTLLVAAWFALFSIPLFLFVPEAQGRRVPLVRAVREGVAALASSVRRLVGRGRLGLFLVARMIYTDGLNTLFIFGGVYAAGTFDMDFAEIVRFGIALNVTAGLGAVGFAWVDDAVGPKATVMGSLLALAFLTTALLLVESKQMLWVLALSAGVFVGPAQAASRSLMARLVPAEAAAEAFGLYALAGKATAFAGPWLVGLGTATFESQRAGMAVIPALLVLGLALLTGVPRPRADSA